MKRRFSLLICILCVCFIFLGSCAVVGIVPDEGIYEATLVYTPNFAPFFPNEAYPPINDIEGERINAEDTIYRMDSLEELQTFISVNPEIFETEVDGNSMMQTVSKYDGAYFLFNSIILVPVIAQHSGDVLRSVNATCREDVFEVVLNKIDYDYGFCENKFAFAIIEVSKLSLKSVEEYRIIEDRSEGHLADVFPNTKLGVYTAKAASLWMDYIYDYDFQLTPVCGADTYSYYDDAYLLDSIEDLQHIKELMHKGYYKAEYGQYEQEFFEQYVIVGCAYSESYEKEVSIDGLYIEDGCLCICLADTYINRGEMNIEIVKPGGFYVIVPREDLESITSYRVIYTE